MKLLTETHAEHIRGVPSYFNRILIQDTLLPFRFSYSFPRSAWECIPRRSASPARPSGADAERPGRRYHAERGNDLRSYKNISGGC